MRLVMLLLAALSLSSALWTFSVGTGSVGATAHAPSDDARLPTSRTLLKQRIWRRVGLAPPRTIFDFRPAFDHPSDDADDEQVAKAAQRWLLTSPTRSDLWLLLCATQRPACPGADASKTLRMAYLVGIGNQAEWAARISLGLGGRDADDPILRDLLKYDVAAGLREIPGSAETITGIYRTASPTGQTQLLDVVRSVDPRMLGVIESGSGAPPNR